MSSKLFVFGASSSINELPRLVKDALFQEMRNDTMILVGDRTKTDYLLQRFLADVGYPNVTVYSSEQEHAYNLGNWTTRRDNIPAGMQNDCTKALALWHMGVPMTAYMAPLENAHKYVRMYDLILNKWC